MNGVLNDIKTEFLCNTKTDLLTLIQKICLNCEFILEPVESFPKKTELVAVMYDTLAVEIFNDLLKYNEQKKDGLA